MTSETPDHWDGDINEAVVEGWTSETTPFERVQEIIQSTSTAQYASEIGERARVSEPTARTHLKRLVETGHAEAVQTGRGTQYKRSRQMIAMRRIVELHRELSREELVEGIKRLRSDINGLKDRFDATDPDDLAIQIEDGDATEAWKAVTEWRSLEESLNVAKAALALYDFDPDTERDTEATGGRGSFADSVSGVGDLDISKTA